MVCILTGHQLKDPNATVGYHSSLPNQIDPKLAAMGIHSASFANGPVPVPNDLEKILGVLRELG